MLTFTCARHRITIHATYLYYIGSIIKLQSCWKKCLIGSMQMNLLYVSTNNMSIKWSHSLGISLFGHWMWRVGWFPWAFHNQQTRSVGLMMLSYWWADIADGGSALTQHWVNVSCLLVGRVPCTSWRDPRTKTLAIFFYINDISKMHPPPPRNLTKPYFVANCTDCFSCSPAHGLSSGGRH